MLHLHHTKYLNHAQPLMTSQAIVSYSNFFKTFSIFTQYMSVSHGYSTIGGIEYGDCGEDKKEKVSHR